MTNFSRQTAQNWKTEDRVAPLLDLVYSGAGGYCGTREFAEKGFAFDDKGIMQWKAKGATVVGRALQAVDKVRSLLMSFFM
jgi:hypothetical protein